MLKISFIDKIARKLSESALGDLLKVLNARKIYHYLNYAEYNLRYEDTARANLEGEEFILDTSGFLSKKNVYDDGGVDISEERLFSYFVEEFKEANCFYDIGSNFGVYTLLSSRYVDEIHSFDMDKRNIRMLESNLKLNDIEICQVNHCAVGREEGQVSYSQSSFGTNSSLVNTGDDVSVEMTTLDSYFENSGSYPDLVKVDVEGAEMNVLKGSEKLLDEEKPRVICEIHHHTIEEVSGCSRKELIDYMKEQGYEVVNLEDVVENFEDDENTEMVAFYP